VGRKKVAQHSIEEKSDLILHLVRKRKKGKLKYVNSSVGGGIGRFPAWGRGGGAGNHFSLGEKRASGEGVSPQKKGRFKKEKRASTIQGGRGVGISPVEKGEIRNTNPK